MAKRGQGKAKPGANVAVAKEAPARPARAGPMRLRDRPLSAEQFDGLQSKLMNDKENIPSILNANQFEQALAASSIGDWTSKPNPTFNIFTAPLGVGGGGGGSSTSQGGHSPSSSNHSGEIPGMPLDRADDGDEAQEAPAPIKKLNFGASVATPARPLTAKNKTQGEPVVVCLRIRPMVVGNYKEEDNKVCHPITLTQSMVIIAMNRDMINFSLCRLYYSCVISSNFLPFYSLKVYLNQRKKREGKSLPPSVRRMRSYVNRSQQLKQSIHPVLSLRHL